MGWPGRSFDLPDPMPTWGGLMSFLGRTLNGTNSMARIFGAILILFGLPFAALGQEAERAAGGGGASEGSTHLVETGETLWELAYRYYGDPFHWPTIFEANRREIEDPHWIYPEERFLIPGAPNQAPRPFPSRGQADSPSTAVVDGVSVRTPGAADPAFRRSSDGPVRRARPSLSSQGTDYRTVFYDNDPIGYGSVVRSGSRDWLVVPRDVFYSSEWLALSEGSAPRMGYVSDFHNILEDEHERLSAKNFDRLRISLADVSGISVGDPLVAFRQHRRQRGLGAVMRPTGRLIVSRIEEEGVIAVVTSEYDRIQIGDMVDRLPPFQLQAGTYPTDVHSDLEGEIAGFGNEQELYGHGDVAFISIGANAGLTMGDELEVRPPRDDEHWPADAVGQVQVLRVQDYMASVRIIGVENPVFVRGARVRLVRKMPTGS